MRIYISAAAVIIIGIMTLGCDSGGISTSNMDKKVPHGGVKVGKSSIEPNIPEKPMPGGYVRKDPDSAMMQKTVKRAVQLFTRDNPGYEFVKLHAAATQVVAGTNYFFRVEFKTPHGNETWDMIVYQKLDNTLSITQKERLD